MIEIATIYTVTEQRKNKTKLGHVKNRTYKISINIPFHGIIRKETQKNTSVGSWVTDISLEKKKEATPTVLFLSYQKRFTTFPTNLNNMTREVNSTQNNKTCIMTDMRDEAEVLQRSFGSFFFHAWATE